MNTTKEKTRLLVVDDNGPILRALCARLNHAGYDVTTAMDPGSALTRAREVMPEIALLDVCMPGLDGFQLAEELRRRVPGCRMLFLTASKAGDLSERAHAAGAVKLLEKPFDSKSLLAEIDALQDHALAH